MHEILLSEYFRGELEQRMWGRCLTREGPLTGSTGCLEIFLLEEHFEVI